MNDVSGFWVDNNKVVWTTVSPGGAKAVTILNQAASLVGGDRDRVHGDKQETFEKIATLWNAWLKVRKEPAAPLTAHDVAIMMASMKAARTQNGEQNPDDYVDMAGYAACAGELA